MTAHPRLDDLRSFAAGEGDATARSALAAHTLACAECRDTLHWVQEVQAAAGAPGEEPPADAWDRIAARVAAGEDVLLPVEERAGASPLRAWRVAGMVLLIAAGAAAADADGWVRQLLRTPFGSSPAKSPATPAEDSAPDAHVPSVALLVEPRDGSVRVSLLQPHDGVQVQVRLTDATELSVEALAGAALATFRTSPGRLQMVGGDSGTVVLDVPRSVRHVEIDVDGRTLLLKERGEIRILAPYADTAASEILIPVRAARSGGAAGRRD